jgi:hypothetical protein
MKPETKAFGLLTRSVESGESSRLKLNLFAPLLDE